MSQTLQENITRVQTLANDLHNMSETVQQRVKNLERDKQYLRNAVRHALMCYESLMTIIREECDMTEELQADLEKIQRYVKAEVVKVLERTQE